MATAIDFKALMQEEKRKALEKLGRAELKAEERSDDRPKERMELSWCDLPDPEVVLAHRQLANMEDYAVGRAKLSGISYIPDFLSNEEAQALIARILSMPQSSWTNLKRRRLQNHGGTPHPDGMIPERVPKFVDAVINSIVQAGIFAPDERPNHVLLNEYKAGQGIMPHQDGPLYQPVVAILSLAGPALLQFWDSLQATKAGECTASVLCQPNSLLVFSEEAYQTHWHGILEEQVDQVTERTVNCKALRDAGVDIGTAVERGERRLSLTVRRVLRMKDEDARIETEEARQEAKRKSQWWLASRGEEGKVFE